MPPIIANEPQLSDPRDETLRADDIAYAEELSAALAAFQETAYLTFPDGSLDAAAALTIAEIAGFLPPRDDSAPSGE